MPRLIAVCLMLLALEAIAEDTPLIPHPMLKLAGNAAAQALCSSTEVRTCLQMDAQQCNDTLGDILPDCSQRLIDQLPLQNNELPQWQYYATRFSRCLGTQLLLQSGLPRKQLQQCTRIVEKHTP